MSIILAMIIAIFSVLWFFKADEGVQHQSVSGLVFGLVMALIVFGSHFIGW